MVHSNIKYLTLISLLFLLTSCFRGQKNNDENNKEVEIPVIIRVQDNDSINCLHLRTLELALADLITTNNLLGKSTNEFIKVFGKPNRITEDNAEKHLIYYAKSFCEADKFTKGADRAWAQFDFKNDTLTIIHPIFCFE